MSKYSLLLSFLFLAIFAQAQDKEHYQLIKNERQWVKKMVNVRGNTEARGFDVIHQDLKISIDPAVKNIEGSVTTTFKVTKEGLVEVVLDLVNELTVDSILYQGSEVTFAHEDGVITIALPSVLPLGTLESVQILYHGNPPSGAGFGSFIQSHHIVDNDTIPVMWTLSEPYGAYEWWPCKQDLTDKIDSLDFTITVPAGNKVGSNGLLVEESTQAGKSTYHWKHRYPIPTYLVAFATTNYVEYSDTITSDSGDILMLNYVYPESLEYAKAGTKDLVPVMELFNDLFGVYPFWKEKYGHAQFGWGGGMEHTTMTFCVYYEIGLLAHELGHQWFGDDVTCGSWEDIWLNEGFATYVEGLTCEHGLGSTTFPDWLKTKIEKVTEEPGGSVKVTDTTNVNSIFSWRLSYSKGAMVLHMLRWKIGDDNFFQGIRNYLNDPAIEYGFARTPQLKAHLEATSGQDLTEFFNSWYSGEGYPLYSITWSQDADNLLRLEVKQTQSTTANYFKMPVPVQAIGTTINQEIVLQNDYDGQLFEVQLSEPIAELQFDPKQWLVAKDIIIHGFVPVGIDGLSIGDQLHLAPNPVQDILSLTANNLEVESLEIFDLTGKLMLRSETSFFEKQDIDVTSLQSGGYVVFVKAKNGKGSIPFVKL